MYSNDTAVKESYFRKIFNTNFNVGFGKPSTDICSTCVRLKNQAKMEKDEEKKQSFILQLKVHKKRAKSFHQLLNRITDDELGINNVRCYVWTENERSRGSSEIALAIYDSLQKVDSAKIRKIRLFSDGCTGQNENMTMISMAAT
ncbi:hypothetical protein ANN_13728 [Periplaneta americana]|uniref:Uncharacterized protein n=1 Tax=Periplaneta americana TaxID=6978 RepID=A0ABQ8SWG7_PERAM|nr:hypothetical protein ANN_13728 [Periplaneta americana]